MRWRVLLACAIVNSISTDTLAETILHAGCLINGRDGRVHEAMSVVIDEGRIVDRGTHETLMSRPGVYRRLFGHQAEPGRSVPT